MKAISTLLAVAGLFTTAFAQVETGGPIAPGIPAAGAEVDAGYSSTCCSDISTCSDNEFPCPREHGRHDHHDYHQHHGHDHSQYINQYVAPVFPAPECPCHDPAPECIHTCQERYCQTCYYEEPCQTCEIKKDPCPPYCQLYTTTATYEYPYTTLSATETCTMTLLSCENEDDRYEPYTQYPDHCEYQYPCHTPHAYGYAHPPRATITATVVPIIHYEEHKHDSRHRKVAEPAPVEGGW